MEEEWTKKDAVEVLWNELKMNEVPVSDALKNAMHVLETDEQPMSSGDGYAWRDYAPGEDGDFYYYGKLPTGDQFVGIVQITTLPQTKQRWCCVLIPPGWRGDVDIKKPNIVHGSIDEWTGQWAGPEFGLSCATYMGEG